MAFFLKLPVFVDQQSQYPAVQLLGHIAKTGYIQTLHDRFSGNIKGGIVTNTVGDAYRRFLQVILAHLNVSARISPAREGLDFMNATYIILQKAAINLQSVLDIHLPAAGIRVFPQGLHQLTERFGRIGRFNVLKDDIQFGHGGFDDHSTTMKASLFAVDVSKVFVLFSQLLNHKISGMFCNTIHPLHLPQEIGLKTPSIFQQTGHHMLENLREKFLFKGIDYRV